MIKPTIDFKALASAVDKNAGVYPEPEPQLWSRLIMVGVATKAPPPNPKFFKACLLFIRIPF
jgi:hypothetical protein